MNGPPAKRWAGRPPFPNGTAKTRMFAVRLTNGERDAIEAAAKRAGKGVTQWAHDALVRAATASQDDVSPRTT